MYSVDTLSCVCTDGCVSDTFLIGSGVHQGFLTPMYWLLDRTDHHDFLGTTIGTVTDLDFSDDVALLTMMF